MMGAFLDALGIAHENGLIQEDEIKPDPAKVAPAAAKIVAEFPAADVRIYLNTLLCQDPGHLGRARRAAAAGIADVARGFRGAGFSGPRS